MINTNLHYTSYSVIGNDKDNGYKEFVSDTEYFESMEDNNNEKD